MTANYHTHTYRCGHASSDCEKVYIEKAIELGFTDLGFSEHAPMPFPEKVPKSNLDRLLAMRMKLHETEDYVKTVLSLREEYKSDINIHLGFEVEYFESCFDAFLKHISPYPVDYLILGQHFGDIFTEPMAHNGKQTGSHTLLKDYVDNVIKAIETGKITYIAHPDLMFYSRSLEIYESEMTRLIKSANEHKIPLEINLYGMQEVRNYPTLAFWLLANDIGCDVVIGSDAHRPENLLNPYAIKYAQKMLQNFKNLNLLEKIDFNPIK